MMKYLSTQIILLKISAIVSLLVSIPVFVLSLIMQPFSSVNDEESVCTDNLGTVDWGRINMCHIY